MRVGTEAFRVWWLVRVIGAAAGAVLVLFLLASQPTVTQDEALWLLLTGAGVVLTTLVLRAAWHDRAVLVDGRINGARRLWATSNVLVASLLVLLTALLGYIAVLAALAPGRTDVPLTPVQAWAAWLLAWSAAKALLLAALAIDMLAAYLLARRAQLRRYLARRRAGPASSGPAEPSSVKPRP